MVGYTVHLYSSNEQLSFSSVAEKNHPLEDQQEGSMEVAVQQEDLQLLARTLQEQFLAEIPSGEFFQIKCAVNKGELMILSQHPVGVQVDTQQVFSLLEEGLRSLPSYRDQRIQCFVRILGEKLPYAKRSLTIKGHQQKDIPFLEPEQLQETPATRDEDFSSLALPLGDDFSTDAAEPEEIFDPLAGTPDLLANPPKRPIIPILLTALAGVVVLGSAGAYLFTRPCVMSECQELQTAEQLNSKVKQLLSSVSSEKELVAIQQQLDTTSAALTVIPQWSSYHEQAIEIQTSLLANSQKIDQVAKAFQTGAVAEQKMQTPPRNQAELQARQQLWRQAITPLESIRPNNELYQLVQPRLQKYQNYLRSINQQLATEEKWVKKLADAKSVAATANNWQATAKSLQEWQKVQSTWQVVINALVVIPQSSPAYTEAQQLLTEYKPQLARARDRVTIEELAARSYQQVLNIANQAKAYEQKQQWQAAVIYWQQALQTAKQISNNSLYYNQAQSLIAPFSGSLQQAQQKLELNNSWQQTRLDLNKTCSGEIRICNFTIDEKGIMVTITPEYEQVLQSTNPETNPPNANSEAGIANHWQSLQEALTVISENANLPLFIYNAQGQAIYMRTPGG